MRRSRTAATDRSRGLRRAWEQLERVEDLQDEQLEDESPAGRTSCRLGGPIKTQGEGRLVVGRIGRVDADKLMAGGSVTKVASRRPGRRRASLGLADEENSFRSDSMKRLRKTQVGPGNRWMRRLLTLATCCLLLICCLPTLVPFASSSQLEERPQDGKLIVSLVEDFSLKSRQSFNFSPRSFELLHRRPRTGVSEAEGCCWSR